MQSGETGVAIVVWRRVGGDLQTLLLRRSLFPPDYEGDWAWSTPGGGRDAAEPPHVAAARELREETGLVLECRPVASRVAAAHTDLDLSVFEAEAPADAKVELSDEHDQFEWVERSELSRCLPSWVSAMYHDVLAEFPVDAGAPLSQIRLVKPGEYLELKDVRLSALAYSEHLVEHLAKERAAPLGFWRDRAERGAAAATMATFVAESESGFAGIVDGFLSEDGRTVEIGGMWVTPSLRRSGVGRELLAAVCDWARKRGAVTAGLWVRAANDAARSLYQREGFAPVRTSDKASERGLRLERLP